MASERKKFYITEKMKEVYERDEWKCQVPGCEKPASQIAHRIAKTKANKRMVVDIANTVCGISCSSELIIHHPFNLRCVCSEMAHNSYWNIGFKRNESTSLVIQIIENLKKEGLV